MKFFSLPFIILLETALIDKYNTYCWISPFNGTYYALCKGIYTIHNASNECILNGYELSKNQPIVALISSTYRLV